jgi:peptidoglycan hydrolase CwlO-like protein
MNKIIATVLSIGSLIGMIYAVDTMYLHRSDFEAFASSYAADKSEAKVDALTQRQWKIEDRIETLKDSGGNDKGIKALEEQKKDLQEQIEREKAKLKGLYEKK